MREALSKAQPEAWTAMVAFFTGVEESEVDDATARTVGMFYTTLLNGVMMQWLFNPETAPTGRDLTEAMRAITAGLAAKSSPSGN